MDQHRVDILDRLCMPVLEDALYFWYVRQDVRRRRAAGEPWPWTPDPNIRDARYTNVRRRDDKTTRWVEDRIRKPFADEPHLWFMLCAARMINRIETLEALRANRNGAWPDGETWSAAEFAAVLAARPKGKKFTGVYITPAPSGGGEGSPGKGTIRGLNLMFGRPVERGIAQYESDFVQRSALREMRELYPILREALIKDASVEIDFSDVPNLMCELSKYLRIKAGGKPKNRYRAQTEPRR